MRYNVQGAPNEPLPIYVQPMLDGTGIKVAWTDNATAGIFNADRCHLTELQLDPMTAWNRWSAPFTLHTFIRLIDSLAWARVQAAYITEVYSCTPTWIVDHAVQRFCCW